MVKKLTDAECLKIVKNNIKELKKNAQNQLREFTELEKKLNSRLLFIKQRKLELMELIK
jgi:hypothetical protein